MEIGSGDSKQLFVLINLTPFVKPVCSDESASLAMAEQGCKISLLFVVSERMPECQINVSSAVRVDDFIRLQCTVNYSGSWIPRFFCFNQHQTPIPATESKKYIYKCSFTARHSQTMQEAQLSQRDNK